MPATVPPSGVCPTREETKTRLHQGRWRALQHPSHPWKKQELRVGGGGGEDSPSEAGVSAGDVRNLGSRLTEGTVGLVEGGPLETELEDDSTHSLLEVLDGVKSATPLPTEIS